MHSNNHFKQLSSIPSLALLTIALLFLQGKRLQSSSQSISTPVDFAQQQARVSQNTLAQLNLWKKLPDFGFKNIMSDWVFLQFLQYFGDNRARNTIGYGLSPDFFENIILRDPYYVYNYLFLSGSTSIFAGLPERAVALMAEGLSYMSPDAPERGYMAWRYKGTDELLFLGDGQAAQESFQKSADWASQASGEEAEHIAEQSQNTADFLADNPVSKRAQIDAWGSILTSGFSQETQQLAIQRIESLGGQVEVTENGRFRVIYPTSSD